LFAATTVQELLEGIVVAVHVIPFDEYAAVVVPEATATKVVPFPATENQLLAAGRVVTVHVMPFVEYAAVVDALATAAKVVPLFPAA
jgi:hypothetical protein